MGRDTGKEFGDSFLTLSLNNDIKNHLPSSSVLTVIAGLAGPCPLTVEALTFNEYTVKGSNPSITP